MLMLPSIKLNTRNATMSWWPGSISPKPDTHNSPTWLPSAQLEDTRLRSTCRSCVTVSPWGGSGDTNWLALVDYITVYGKKWFLLFLFGWTVFWQDFKEVLAELLGIMAVGLADKSDGIRQLHISLGFLQLILCHSSYSLFVICFMAGYLMYIYLDFFATM